MSGDGEERSSGDLVARLGACLGHAFSDEKLALLALTHPSFAHEQGEGRGNERLEFLGDAVLDLVVAERLFAAHPGWNEGQLTRTRAALVRREALAVRARALGLPELVRLGRTELLSEGAEKSSILANAYEAVIGALYLDAGLDAVRREVATWPMEGGEGADPDAKTAFQEWAHATLQATPTYHTVHDSGIEADEQRFGVEVRVGDETFGRGVGRSKRRAERAAARNALEAGGDGPGDREA